MTLLCYFQKNHWTFITSFIVHMRLSLFSMLLIVCLCYRTVHWPMMKTSDLSASPAVRLVPVLPRWTPAVSWTTVTTGDHPPGTRSPHRDIEVTRRQYNYSFALMHKSITGYNPYNLFSCTIDYSKNFTTNKVLTIWHMPMFVVKSIVILINSLAYGSINSLMTINL